jgi:N-acetylglucosaminyldiphosphoundecaprenol N-acetyl-beta-D-mannosaminyltransferase
MHKIKFLRIPLHNVTLYEAVESVAAFVRKRDGCHPVFALNANKVDLLLRGTLPMEVFDSASLILPDGISVVYGARLFGHRIKGVVGGVDLMLECFKMANAFNHSVFFLGSPQDLLGRMIVKCSQEYPNIRIAGSQHGYYPLEEEMSVVSKISSARPDLLFVAFGSPRKELFIHRYREILNAKVALAVGGSYEVFIGDKKRGPAWGQKLGLEWVNRLIQDPGRLWKRYLETNTRFLFYLLMNGFFTKHTHRKSIIKDSSYDEAKHQDS